MNTTEDGTSFLASKLRDLDSKLAGLYDELGIPEEERVERGKQIYEVISKAIDDHVNSVQAECDQLKDHSSDLKASLSRMIGVLGDYRHPKLSAEQLNEIQILPPLIPLHSMLQHLEDQITKVYNSRHTKLLKLVEQISSMVSEPEGLELPEKLVSILNTAHTPNNLSNSTISFLDSEAARIHQINQERLMTAHEVAKDIAEVYKALEIPDAEWDPKVLQLTTDMQSVSSMSLAEIRYLQETFVANAKTLKERRDYLNNLINKVSYLWDRLGEDPTRIDQFKADHDNLSRLNISAYESELQIQLENKRKHMAVFISDARKQLTDLCQTLYYSPEETVAFVNSSSDDQSEETLNQLESDIASLQERCAKFAPLLNAVKAYFELRADKEELERSEKDPDRLKSRNTSRILLREEKIRKKLRNQKPLVLKSLRAAANQFHLQYSEHFRVNGKPILDVIEEDQEAEKEAAALAKAARSRPTAAKSAPTNTSSTRPSTSSTSASTNSSRKPVAARPRIERSAGPVPVKRTANAPVYRSRTTRLAASRSAASAGAKTPSSVASAASGKVLKYSPTKRRPIRRAAIPLEQPITSSPSKTQTGIQLAREGSISPKKVNTATSVLQARTNPTRAPLMDLESMNTIAVPAADPFKGSPVAKKSMNWLPYEDVSSGDEDEQIEKQYELWRKQALERMQTTG
ncbi:hypothetical protein CANCADRAFT_75803 [Tortispora caseinolytica NRRL Y-17796]|uniref:Uncharacterized protein n=1 Tax=Tortispora caseinolytica NRRL Y-17796 TaxID=767744 RepID=A0A1E4TJ62_9ASCO|nr:hypothetical protein CANCADRAFT_75803 [Tortispora caseinolytica NRRL Y-17796]